MNKHEFLHRLTNALSGLAPEEIQKTADYYGEMIDDAVEEGEDEQAVVERLGSINDIAAKILGEAPLRQAAAAAKRPINVPVIVLLIIGSPIWVSLLLALLAVVLSVYIALWSVVISLFSVFGVLALSGVGLLVTSPFVVGERPLQALLLFGTALICMGLSVFMFYFSLWCAKQAVTLAVYAARNIKKLFVKRRSGASENK